MRRLKLLDGFTVKNASVLGFEINALRVVKVKSCWQLACWCMKSVPMTAYSLVLDATPREKNELSPEHGQRLRYPGYLVSFLGSNMDRFMSWKIFCKAQASPLGPREDGVITHRAEAGVWQGRSLHGG